MSPGTGAATAALAYVCIDQIGIVDLAGPVGIVYGVALAAVAGALLVRWRATRILLYAGIAAAVLAFVVVRYTPAIDPALRNLRVGGAPMKADAVVALTSWVYEDGSLDGEGLVRLVRALEMVGQGYAPRVVVTRLDAPGGDRQEAQVRGLMQRLGIRAEVIAVGPVLNTRDEAVQTAAAVRQHGWGTVLLVTSGVHSRRAMESFAAAGVRVIPVGSGDPSFGPRPAGAQRLTAFRAILHEYVGRLVYQWRGWIPPAA
jgi:uncharacterized SAM-binding protein YcdF (DUF218 family)